jgi:CheY-like chemotaxis protein
METDVIGMLRDGEVIQQDKMANKKVLYGDDREDMRNSLAKALREKNLEVELELVDNHQELVARAKANNYDAVISDLDYSPEGREGYEVLKQIRHLPAIKVLYTGEAGFEYEAEAFEHGADYAVLRKNEIVLVSLLEKLLGGQQNGK